jgi:hypothetical protein
MTTPQSSLPPTKSEIASSQEREFEELLRCASESLQQQKLAASKEAGLSPAGSS